MHLLITAFLSTHLVISFELEGLEIKHPRASQEDLKFRT